MKHLKIIMAAACACLGASMTLAETDSWVGFYQAIDPEDGSTNYMSIVPNANGAYIIQVSVTEHAKCGAPAVFVATGRLVNGQMLREKTKLRCKGGEATEHQDAVYTLDAGTGIVSLSAPFDGRTLFYHRTSAR
ncbi:MAG: hypothetical protein AAGA28_16240 [Pseudomonadota bacterium]